VSVVDGKLQLKHAPVPRKSDVDKSKKKKTPEDVSIEDWQKQGNKVGIIA